MELRLPVLIFLLLADSALAKDKAKPTDNIAVVRQQADRWRAEHRFIDLHQHIDYTEERLARDVRIMDTVGLSILTVMAFK